MMRLLSITLFSLIFLCGCTDSQSEKEYLEIRGETMGTYYRIVYQPLNGPVDKSDVDRKLEKLNEALSTYVPSSLISLFNKTAEVLDLSNVDTTLVRYFTDNFELSSQISAQTDAYFDPTVMPLVNYWGFGYEKRQAVNPGDSQQIDSLKQYIGLDKVHFDEASSTISKDLPGVQLDFSAVAKGYAIDEIGMWLASEFGVRNYLVDIGGESRAQGVNRSGTAWRTGISIPVPGISDLSYDHIIALDNTSIATSGNYRNFYEVDGMTISHTMNPKTGYFERNTLLSVTIVAPRCAVADAFATACMSMGLDRAREIIESISGIEALFIYMNEENTSDWYATGGMQQIHTQPSN